MKAVNEKITLTEEDFKLLKEKGRIYADGELKELLIEVVFDDTN